MHSVMDVAYYVLNKCGKMTTMKLQKLVYYCQAWSLAWDDKPLFQEDFEAWANGPVCRELYDLHKGQYEIDKSIFDEASLDLEFVAEEQETMDVVLRDYGVKSPFWLSELTHNERPWKNARRGYSMGEPSAVVIDKEEMQSYYGELACE